MLYTVCFVPSGAVFDPSDGLMLLFPSPMLHLVHPTEGDAPRITVAFDLGIRYFASAAISAAVSSLEPCPP